MRALTFISVSFFFIVLGYLIFQTKDDNNTTQFNVDPIIKVENFSSKTFSGTNLKERFIYDRGRLEEPNRFFVEGKYRWDNFLKNSRVKRAQGTDLVVTFLSTSLLSTVGGADIDDVLFSDRFTFSTPSYDLTSEYATYYSRKNIFVGNNPAYIRSEKSRIQSSDGFRIDLGKDNFELFGEIDGLFLDSDLIGI